MPLVSWESLLKKWVVPAQQVTDRPRPRWRTLRPDESFRASNESFQERIEHDELTPTSRIGTGAQITNREANEVRNPTNVARQY